MLVPSEDTEPWLESIRKFSKKWNTALSPLLVYHVSDFVSVHVDGDTVPSTSCQFACSFAGCAYVATSGDALKTHLFRCHGYLNPTRFYVSADHMCHACFMRFHNRDDAVKHVAYTPKQGLRKLQAFLNPLPLDEVKELDSAEVVARTERRKSRHPRMPPLKVAGPLLPSADARDGSRLFVMPQ